MDTITRDSESIADTEEAGRIIGALLRPGDVIRLTGDLGAGKTVFVKGMCAGVEADPQQVRSPTFVLAHLYRGGRIPLLHVDCYRLGPNADLDVIDIEDVLIDGAVAVEWGEYADLSRYRCTTVTFDILEDDGRRMHLDTSEERLYEAWMR